ncbi:Protein WVD2-like 4 isoform B [Glycine soja]|uniref:Protein WVD2-like 4 isoform B n=1 Tax=Glycine soja TaxID=3848 RepID=A0A445IJT1_GLYSO|nr:Protein WVD2-like 4 isoform B [Glycine soja]
MESENGVAMEDEKHVIGETTKENINKEAENSCNSEIQTKNEVSEAVVKVEGPKSAASKISKLAKEHGGKGGVASKNNKSATKDKPNLKSTTSSQTHRPNLSKSLSLPAKSAGGDGMKKSTNGTLAKPETKHANGAKAEASIRRLSRLTNSEVNSKEAKTNTGNSNQRTSLASMISLKTSESGISTPVNAVTKSLTSEESLPVDQISIPAKTEKPNKEEDDAHSTTSYDLYTITPRSFISHTPRRRSSGSGFSFRLEERAEKRKEFFSKLEEKIQEKEAEKTNQQEKSKENQEAEIKQLRKTMTFKATPMPSFYKEPPPKVELKKIPITRPKSPKLGRHKGSAVNKSADKSCSSPHGKQQQNDPTKAKAKGSNKEVISKKPIRKIQAKVQSQESAIRKTEKDSVKPTKVNQDAKAGTGNNEECHDPSVNNSEYQNDMELESKNELDQNVALVLNSSPPEIVSYEVAVGV